MTEDDYQEMLADRVKARKERIATAIMAGFAANPRAIQYREDDTRIEQTAVRWADDLIAELDKGKK